MVSPLVLQRTFTHKILDSDRLDSLFLSVAEGTPSSAVATSTSSTSTVSAFELQKARILSYEGTAGTSVSNALFVGSDSDSDSEDGKRFPLPLTFVRIKLTLSEEDTAATVLLLQERMDALAVSDKDVASVSSACPSSASSSPQAYDPSRAKVSLPSSASPSRSARLTLSSSLNWTRRLWRSGRRSWTLAAVSRSAISPTRARR